MAKPLIISDCDEVLLHMIVPFRDWLDESLPKVGNAPLGFWMAQQGSIICFVIILYVYKHMMNKLEGEEGFTSKK